MAINKSSSVPFFQRIERRIDGHDEMIDDASRQSTRSGLLKPEIAPIIGANHS
jgi:hypothetical protein